MAKRPVAGTGRGRTRGPSTVTLRRKLSTAERAAQQATLARRRSAAAFRGTITRVTTRMTVEVAQLEKRAASGDRRAKDRLKRVRELEAKAKTYRGRIGGLSSKISRLQKRVEAGDLTKREADVQIARLKLDQETIAGHLYDAVEQEKATLEAHKASLMRSKEQMKRGGRKAGYAVAEARAETQEARTAREAEEKARIAAEERASWEEHDKDRQKERADWREGEVEVERARRAEEAQRAAAAMKKEGEKRQRVIGVAKSAIAKQRTARRVAEADVDALRTDYADAAEELRELGEQRNRLLRDLERERGDAARAAQLRRQLSGVDRRLTATTGRVRELEGHLEQAERATRAARSEAGRAGQRLGRARRARIDAEQRAMALEEELANVSQQLEAARSRGASEGELGNITTRLESLEALLGSQGYAIDERGRILRASGGGLIYNPVQAIGGGAPAAETAARLGMTEEQLSQVIQRLTQGAGPEAEDAMVRRIRAIDQVSNLNPAEKKDAINALVGVEKEKTRPGSEKFREGVTNVGEGIRGFGLFGTGLMRDALYVIILALLVYFVAQLFSYVGMI